MNRTEIMFENLGLFHNKENAPCRKKKVCRKRLAFSRLDPNCNFEPKVQNQPGTFLGENISMESLKALKLQMTGNAECSKKKRVQVELVSSPNRLCNVGLSVSQVGSKCTQPGRQEPMESSILNTPLLTLFPLNFKNSQLLLDG